MSFAFEEKQAINYQLNTVKNQPAVSTKLVSFIKYFHQVSFIKKYSKKLKFLSNLCLSSLKVICNPESLKTAAAIEVKRLRFVESCFLVYSLGMNSYDCVVIAYKIVTNQDPSGAIM